MEKVYIWTKDKGYHYQVKCMDCQAEYEMITGVGRYGFLGEFDCPYCKRPYFASNEDNEEPCLYIARLGDQPLNMFDSEGHKRCLKIEYNGKGMY